MKSLMFTSTGISWLDNLINEILYFIPKVMYFLWASLTQIIDLCQALFRKLVGLDTYYMAGNKVEQSGDILFAIFRNTFLGEGVYKSMNTAFWSITLLGLILLFITTIAGILRNEYTPDKEKLNSKSGVMKNAFKALISLIVIPLTCFFCLFVGNSVIVAVDAATQPQTAATVVISEEVEGLTSYELDNGKKTYSAFALWGTTVPTSYTPISGIIFRAACTDANRVRLSDDFYNNVIMMKDEVPEGYTTNFNAFNHADSQEECANMIDEAFELNIKITNPSKLYTVEIIGGNTGLWHNEKVVSSFNRFNVGMISYYYDLWHFDFIVAFAFAIFIGKLFLEITLGLMQRLIEIMGLIFFLPIVASFMPVDNGAGFGKWRAHFITKTLSAYVTIISLNIFFIIYPLLKQFQFFGPGFEIVDRLLSSIFVLAGLLSIKTLNNMFATMFMIDKITANVMDSGANAMGGVKDLAEKGVKSTVGVAKLPLAPVIGGMKHGFAAGAAKFQANKEKRLEEKREKAINKAGQQVADQHNRNTLKNDFGLKTKKSQDSFMKDFQEYQKDPTKYKGSTDVKDLAKYEKMHIDYNDKGIQAYNENADQFAVDNLANFIGSPFATGEQREKDLERAKTLYEEYQKDSKAFYQKYGAGTEERAAMKRFEAIQQQAQAQAQAKKEAGERFDQQQKNKKAGSEGFWSSVGSTASTAGNFLSGIIGGLGGGGGKKK